MKALKIALLGSSFLLGAATVASAADVYNKGGGLKDEPYAAYAPITWAGFYAGAHVGATFGDELKFDYGHYGSETADVNNGLLLGIHGGYNWQTANWVYGVEVDLDLSNADIKDENVETTDYLATIRGRLGYAFGNSLVYATGGVGFLNYSDVFDFSDDTAVGFVVGGGIEHKLSSNFSIGLEGLYYNFSSEAGRFEDTSVDVDRDFWAIRARASYHFGSRSDEPLK